MSRLRFSAKTVMWLGLLLCGLLVGLSAAWAYVRYSKDKFFVSRCARNLSFNMRSLLDAYALEHDGAFPSDWCQLFDAKPADVYQDMGSYTYDDPRKLLTCIAASMRRFGRYPPCGDWAIADSEYQIEAGIHRRMPGSFILVYDRTGTNHSDGSRNILFLDGHVETWGRSRETELQQRLAKQREAVVSWPAPNPAVETEEAGAEIPEAESAKSSKPYASQEPPE